MVVLELFQLPLHLAPEARIYSAEALGRAVGAVAVRMEGPRLPSNLGLKRVPFFGLKGFLNPKP